LFTQNICGWKAKGMVGLEGIEGREWKGKMKGKGRTVREGGRIVS
jgi:hypothetical protein